MLNEDYSEILHALLRNKAKFLVVGAYAMGIYGYPRATGDFDILVEPSVKNSQKIYKSLQEFGAPLNDITEETFHEEGIIFQIGVAPRRIDLITQIDGVTFKDAYAHKELVKIENLHIPFLSKSDLIKNKESTGREKDKLDVKYLRQKKL
ncbi:MAG: hypothetical protein HY210_05480 [Candidatus Omnitrophica bacterium]|nr:hypothetical protein [Candidatus Omnitrophota bacterium]MBI5024899.1 hypothetical protein [Candidatus Omnitrophota bacterium]